MIQGREENGKLIIALTGKIDSSNAGKTEEELHTLWKEHPCTSVELDCDLLEYCTSAGLRMILRLKQKVDDTVLTNVHPELYNIFDMTGFTDMMEIRKAYRVISVEGCEVIGQGANGHVYRIDPDTIVKVYVNSDSLPEIHRERELARLAFVAGVPTAIPYDVVRIQSGGYGSVFELLNAVSFSKLLVSGEKTADEIAEMSIRLLKLIHSKEVRSENLPDMKAVVLKWVEFLRDYLPEDQYEKLYALVSAVPEDRHLLHGDFHIKNILLQNGESLLIDMDTLSHGHPVFELAAMYNAYVGFGLASPGYQAAFLGVSEETCRTLWRRSLELYFETRDAKIIHDVESKAKIVGLTRLMRREIRRDGLNREDGRKMIDVCRAELAETLQLTDTLVF